MNQLMNATIAILCILSICYASSVSTEVLKKLCIQGRAEELNLAGGSVDWDELEQNVQALAGEKDAEAALTDDGTNFYLETPAGLVNYLVDTFPLIGDQLAAIDVLLVLTNPKGHYTTYLTDVQRLFVLSKTLRYLRSIQTSWDDEGLDLKAKKFLSIADVQQHAWNMRGQPDVKKACRENRGAPAIAEICQAIDDFDETMAEGNF